MVVTFRCDVCGKPYSLKSELAGKTIHCKSCSHRITVPLNQDGLSTTDADEFLDSLSEAVDESFDAPVPLPKSGRRPASRQSRSKRSSRGRRTSGYGPAEYSYAACLLLGLILVMLILKYSAGFFGFFLFFAGICFAAAWSKTESGNRWSVPAVGVIAGYTIMLTFGAVVSRNAAIAVDLIVMGIGLAVFVSSPGVLGVAVLAGIFLLEMMYLSGAFGGLDVALMDQKFRWCHLLATATCMIYLVAGYLYHVWTTYVSRSSRAHRS